MAAYIFLVALYYIVLLAYAQIVKKKGSRYTLPQIFIKISLTSSSANPFWRRRRRWHRQRRRAPIIRGTLRCRTWPRCWDTTRWTPGCGGAVAAAAVGDGGAAVATTTTTANRAPASRSTASGISAVWPRPAVRPRTACSPETFRRHRASAADRPCSWATHRPSSHRTRAAGRGTRWACCACAAPTVAWDPGRGSGTTTKMTRHRLRRRNRSSPTPNGAWNWPRSATTNCRPLHRTKQYF